MLTLSHFEVVAARTWIGSDAAGLVGWAGLLVSIVGLKATFDQAKQAKKAAENAEDSAAAAQRAVDAVRGKLEASTAAYANSTLSTVITLINNDAYEAAEAHFIHIRRAIGIKFGIDAEGKFVIPHIAKAVGVIDNCFQRYRSTKDMNKELINKSIRILMDTATHWEIKTTSEGDREAGK